MEDRLGIGTAGAAESAIAQPVLMDSRDFIAALFQIRDELTARRIELAGPLRSRVTVFENLLAPIAGWYAFPTTPGIEEVTEP